VRDGGVLDWSDALMTVWKIDSDSVAAAADYDGYSESPRMVNICRCRRRLRGENELLWQLIVVGGISSLRPMFGDQALTSAASLAPRLWLTYA